MTCTDPSVPGDRMASDEVSEQLAAIACSPRNRMTGPVALSVVTPKRSARRRPSGPGWVRQVGQLVEHFPERGQVLRQAGHRSLRDGHGAQLVGPVVDVAENVAVESLQVGEVIPAGQPPPFQVDQPRRGQRCLSPGQFGGIGDAQQVAQHAAGRIQIGVTGRAAHLR